MCLAKGGILLASAEIFNYKRKLLQLAFRVAWREVTSGEEPRVPCREIGGKERENEIRGEHLVELSQSVKDGRLMLADGQSIPLASGICDTHRLIADDQDLPICDWYMGGHKV